MTKDALRRQLRRLRRAIPDREAQSERITGHLRDLPGWVLVYVSVHTEVDTRSLLAGERILVPRVEGDQIVAVPLGELVPGAYGIPTCAGPAHTGPIDVVLTPGLGFDREGGRLGYGAGYYDRFFARYPRSRRIALCFREQLLDRLPTETHDVPMHALCTPDGWLEIG